MVKLSRKWKDRAVTVHNLDPEACEREMNRLAKAGALTPEALVAQAKDKDSALHDGFEWDDTVAGHQYRLQQAGAIIRALVVVEERPDGEATERRVFVNVRPQDEEGSFATKGCYVTTATAMSNEQYREYVLQIALRDASAYADKYRDFEELARIVKAIDKTVVEYEREHATA